MKLISTVFNISESMGRVIETTGGVLSNKTLSATITLDILLAKSTPLNS